MNIAWSHVSLVIYNLGCLEKCFGLFVLFIMKDSYWVGIQKCSLSIYNFVWAHFFMLYMQLSQC